MNRSYHNAQSSSLINIGHHQTPTQQPPATYYIIYKNYIIHAPYHPHTFAPDFSYIFTEIIVMHHFTSHTTTPGFMLYHIQKL